VSKEVTLYSIICFWWNPFVLSHTYLSKPNPYFFGTEVLLYLSNLFYDSEADFTL
jgi:hypothetical protein